MSEKTSEKTRESCKHYDSCRFVSSEICEEWEEA